jgi:hypothetical protein
MGAEKYDWKMIEGAIRDTIRTELSKSIESLEDQGLTNFAAEIASGISRVAQEPDEAVRNQLYSELMGQLALVAENHRLQMNYHGWQVLSATVNTAIRVGTAVVLSHI